MDKKMEALRLSLPSPSGTLELKNPVLTASGTFGYGLEFAPYGDLTRLGGIITKGLSLRPREGNPVPRIAETPCGMLNSVGLQNCGVEEFVSAYLPRLNGLAAESAESLAVIVNIYGRSVSEFSELASILSEADGICALEVNISCPNVSSGGMAFGQNPAEAARVTEAVKKAAGALPVMVKLSPNVTDIAGIAKACEAAGADWLSCINTVAGLAVDLQTRAPLLANVTGGLSGAAIKPIALRCVREVRKAVKIPVIGLGGISSARDILEFILVGAHAVQIGTANFQRPDMAWKLVQDLADLMDKMEIRSLEDFRGTLRA